jgi:uncharacterized membrane protein
MGNAGSNSAKKNKPGFLERLFRKNRIGKYTRDMRRRRAMRNTDLFIFCAIMTGAIASLRSMQVVFGFIDDKGLFVSGKTIENAMPFWHIAITLLGSMFVFLNENRSLTTIFKKSVNDTRKKEIRFCGLMIALLGAVYLINTIRESDVPSMLCAAGFLGAGIITYMQKRFVPSAGFLMILPCVGYTCAAVNVFSENYILIKKPQQLTLFVCNIACAMFFLLMGRIVSRNDTAMTRVRLAAFGATTITAILSETISGIFIYFYSGIKNNKSFALLPNLQLVVSAAVVIAVLVVFSLRPGEKIQTDAPENQGKNK